MKTSEKLAFGPILLVFLFLSLNLMYSQGKTASSDPQSQNKAIVALLFPLRVDTLDLSQPSSQKIDEKALKGLLSAALAPPQTLVDGSPYPEALSLSTLMEASIRANAKLDGLNSIDLESIKSLKTAEEDASLFQDQLLKNANILLFTMYTIQDMSIQFKTFLVSQTGEGTSYSSKAVSVFKLSEATDEAVHDFIVKKALSAKEQGSGSALTSTGGLNDLSASALPVIPPWGEKSKYEQANSRLQFSIGGTTIGLCVSMVCFGLWETYQEAAYRNTNFENAVTISGIATGTSAAVTAAFLISAFWNATLMLRASH